MMTIMMMMSRMSSIPPITNYSRQVQNSISVLITASCHYQGNHAERYEGTKMMMMMMMAVTVEIIPVV